MSLSDLRASRLREHWRNAVADGADVLGVAASITTFSTWMEEGYLAFANFDGYRRGGLYDVSLLSF